MLQLRWIATYSRRLRCPQTPDILNRSTPAQQQQDTSNWRQSFVVTEYLTCGASRFHVMTLTFDLVSFNVCSASAVTWPNHVPNFRKKKRKIRDGIHRNNSSGSDTLGELTALSQTQWPNLNFSCVRRSLLGAFSRVVPSALVASPLKLWIITASTIIAIPKFKDRSRDSGYAGFAESRLRAPNS